MTRPYSEDIRELALARADAGETVRSIAGSLQISPSCISKWKKLRQETGGLVPGKIGGHKKPVLSGDNADWLRQRLRLGPFTLRQLARELVSRTRSSQHRVVFCWGIVTAEARDRGQDVIGGFGRSERFGIGVVAFDERGDVRLEGGDAAIDPAPDLLVGEEREEALELVAP